MNKAIIVGVYGFLGYSLCSVLLEKGVSVEGISLLGEEEEHIIEEKRLQIGRNANFTEVAFQDWPEAVPADLEDTHLIIPVYDIYSSRLEQSLFKDQFIAGKLKHLKGKQSLQVTLIHPIQLAVKPEHCLIKEEIDAFKKELKNSASFQEFYIPTLFGPWQPKSFYFHQQMLGGEGNGKVLDEREWVYDALFIEDVTLEVIRKIGSKDQSGYIFESGENQWANCVVWLEAPKGSQIRPFRKLVLPRDDLKIKQPEILTSFKEGLQRQKKQFECLNERQL
ncbi:hypothetical protein [Mesobacillus harenae]|uniref:hypothetical protein n=1 Tax=Mesobacillus harenae TaxID=2213203 RepID=UPI00158013C7|nr:hypothetical protein [Mesobacillus harenae]